MMSWIKDKWKALFPPARVTWKDVEDITPAGSTSVVNGATRKDITLSDGRFIVVCKSFDGIGVYQKSGWGIEYYDLSIICFASTRGKLKKELIKHGIIKDAKKK